MFILNLIQNIALLVALAALYQVIGARFRKESLENKIISGFLFGIVGTIGMMTPLHYSPGIIFDGRNIILNIAGLFGGPVVALVAASMMGAYRVFIGGIGVYVGVATIAQSALLGVIFYYWLNWKQKKITLLNLWLFGLLSNIVLLLIFLALPGDAGISAVKQLGLAILILYPLATMLLGQLFVDYERQLVDAEALHQSESLYRGIFENAASGVDVVDRDGRFVQVNSTLCRILGYSREEMLKMTILDISHPDDREISEVKHQQMVSGQTGSYKFVKRYVRKDGQIVWGEASVAAVMGADGAYYATVGVISDITPLKQSEVALRERERMWMTMIGNLPGFVYRCANDRRWTMEYLSPGCVEITGYAPEDLLMNHRLSFNDVVDPEYRQQLWEKWQEALKGRQSFEGEYPIITRDGSRKWIWERGKGVFSDEGTLMFLEGFITDVTQRRQAEEALKDSNQRYQELFEKSRRQEELYLSMFNCSADPIIVYDLEGNVKYLNPAHTEIFGWTLDELHNKPFETVPEWDKESTVSIIKGILETGQTYRSYETQRLTRDNRLVDVSISASRYLDHKGATAGMLVIIQNISGRKKAQEVQKRLATAIEQAAEAVVITDSEAVIQYVNPAFEQITGYSTSEVIGKNPNLLKSGLHEDSFYQRLWETIERGEVWRGRLTNKKKDGSIYYEDATISPVRDLRGKIQNYVAVKRDVTETIELTQQLLHSQKMEAIGTLAGGIAHDFNNLLQVVMGYCEILMESKGPDHAEFSDLQKIYLAGKKGADLVKKLLTFSRNEQTKLVETDLNAEITQVCGLLLRTIAKSVKMDLNLSGDLSLVDADPNQLAQVIMNLILNARDAMPDGGTLSIETRNVSLDEEYCSKHFDVKPGNYVRLVFSDTGEGMDKSTMDHIFEPFFSTKEVGKGTGLGLATVYGIVKNHAGHLTCESSPGKGSTFRIYFPVVKPR